MMSDLQSPQQVSTTAPSALLSAPLSDEQLSNVITNWNNKKQITYFIRPPDDVDTNIKQALEEFFAKAEPNAYASAFRPEVVPVMAKLIPRAKNT